MSDNIATPEQWAEYQQSPDYLQLPEQVRTVMEAFPPTQYYQLESGKQCVIYSVDENEGGEVTLTVDKTGRGGMLAGFGLGALDSNSVSGLLPSDLKPWTE